MIEKLKRKGLINDLEFAKAWVESRSKKKGTIALKSELFQKGIDREIVEEVISSWFTVHGQEQTAKTLLEKRIERWKNLPEKEIKQKALRFLQSRGFDYDTSKEVIENILEEGV
ncbi:regulatory protein RecX [Candidatus Daviesbacteria bacterium]|nr:regulatory protein RecX [Candidatus Daviesbacteria bacterium]